MLTIEFPGHIAKKIDLVSSSYPESNNSQISAANDIEAVSCWLKRNSTSSKTYDTYQREGRRFLMWCASYIGKTINQLKVQDFEEYIKFLQAPPPSWCTTRANLRKGIRSKLWRPFVGPLSPSAVSLAISSINSLMSYLNNGNYIGANPLKLVNKHCFNKFDFNQNKYQVQQRMLQTNEWQALQQALLVMPEDSKNKIIEKYRARLLISLLYYLGLRISEVASHLWSSFAQKNGKWWFFVIGKGGKFADIPVNDELLTIIKVYRLEIGKSALPNSHDSTPIFTNGDEAISSRQLYNIVKKIGARAASFINDSTESKQRLIKLSPHWLRHLCASHQDKAGINLSIIKQNMRHTSRQTTEIYVHTEDDLRHEAIQKMSSSLESNLDIKTNKLHLLSIILVGGPVAKCLGLTKFLIAVEQEIIKFCNFTYNGYSRNEIISKVSDIQQKISINYLLEQFDEADGSNIIDAIKIEAKIRLFSLNKCLITEVGLAKYLPQHRFTL